MGSAFHMPCSRYSGPLTPTFSTAMETLFKLSVFEMTGFTQKEITSQTDYYLVILSSKTYVFEDSMTKC